MLSMIFIILAVIIGFVENKPVYFHQRRDAVEKYSDTQRKIMKCRWARISQPSLPV